MNSIQKFIDFNVVIKRHWSQSIWNYFRLITLLQFHTMLFITTAIETTKFEMHRMLAERRDHPSELSFVYFWFFLFYFNDLRLLFYRKMFQIRYSILNVLVWCWLIGKNEFCGWNAMRHAKLQRKNWLKKQSSQNHKYVLFMDTKFIWIPPKSVYRSGQGENINNQGLFIWFIGSTWAASDTGRN